MKRIFLSMVLAVALLGFIGSAFAQLPFSPTAPFSGSKGLFRVIDANNNGPMSFGIGLYGTYWSKSYSITGGGKVDFTQMGVNPMLSFAPIKFIELSASVPYAMYKFKTSYGGVDSTINVNGLMDAEVGLKFSYKFNPMFTAGLRGVVMVPTLADTFQNKRLYGTTLVKTVQNNPDVGGDLLLTFNFVDKAKLHINGGAMYSMDKRDSAQTYVKYSSPLSVNFGGGLEYDGFPYVTPMVEVTSSYPMLGDKSDDSTRYILKDGATATTKPGPMDYLLFTGGLKFDKAFSRVHHLGLALGVDVPLGATLTDFVDTTKTVKPQFFAWQVVGGLTYSYIPPVGPAAPATGSIAGVVTDTDKNPISGADVAFTGTSVAPVTSGADGKFAATGLPAGMITVSVSKDGFNTKDEQATIGKKKVANVTIALEKKQVPKATLSGKISDTEGKAVAGATVASEGSTATSDVSGSYNMDVVVAQGGGTYNVNVTAPGYKDKSGTVAMTPGQPAAKDFTLVSATLKMTMVIKFKTGSATIMGASADIDRAAAILKDNPNVKVEIAGYTDSRGSSRKNLKLSQLRADATMAALVAAGVPAGQLTAKGYGAASPVASNKTAKGRAENRRIELHVL
jgi:outer membrane protein OmpA-like peptidoglycan-associated protein